MGWLPPCALRVQNAAPTCRRLGPQRYLFLGCHRHRNHCAVGDGARKREHDEENGQVERHPRFTRGAPVYLIEPGPLLVPSADVPPRFFGLKPARHVFDRLVHRVVRGMVEPRPTS